MVTIDGEGEWMGRERVMRVAKHKKSVGEVVRRGSCGGGEEEWGRREGEGGRGDKKRKRKYHHEKTAWDIILGYSVFRYSFVAACILRLL